MRRCAFFIILAAVLTPVGCTPVASGSSSDHEASTPATDQGPAYPVAQARRDAADRELLGQVSRRLQAVMERLPDYVSSPRFSILEENKINAFATAQFEGEGAQTRVLPQVVVYGGLFDQVVKVPEDAAGDPDRLAFVLSHELGHVVLGHIVRPRPGQTEMLQLVFGRKQENDADVKGMELAMKAGYSFRRGRSVIDRMKQLGLTYSSFEGLGVDHPSWNDRLSVLDKEQTGLWQAMSAFQNGTFFLFVEQYPAAEKSFRQVVKEFPQCSEAWANLGNALLMQYCDGLNSEDLRNFAIGQVAVGGFYQRPESLESLVRGVNKEQWQEAVEALQKALALKNELVLARANLGLAYLVAPQGQDLDRATQNLNDAAEKAGSDPALTPVMRAAVWNNAAVADFAADRKEVGARKLDQAAAIYQELGSKLPNAPATLSVFVALLYNQGLFLAASPDKAGQPEAVKALEQYFQSAAPTSAWWPLAFERYAKLCQDLRLPAKSRDLLAKRDAAELRLLTSPGPPGPSSSRMTPICWPWPASRD
jgi:predicted Zn-dependent protease